MFFFSIVLSASTMTVLFHTITILCTVRISMILIADSKQRIIKRAGDLEKKIKNCSSIIEHDITISIL